MAVKSNNHEAAKLLFLKGYAQKDIARMLGVSEVSISRWQKKEKWSEVKDSLINSKYERLNELYEELKEFNRMIKEKEDYKVADSKEADAHRKLIADIKDLETKYNIGEVVTMSKDFLDFVREVDEDFARSAIDYFDAFINDILEKNKWQQ